MVGGRFTWERGRGTESWVEERLDRAVATVEWAESYEETLVRKIRTLQSAHSAIYVDIESRPVRAATHSFKFESAWLLEEGCAKVVDEAWRQSTGLDFQQRITLCGQRLARWGGEHFRRFGNRIRELRSRLDSLQEDRAPQAVDEFLAVEGELEILLQQEEIFWKQRSKQLWLKHGDANTSYFHKAASARCRRNLLVRVKDPGGTWKEGTTMHEEILRYYDCTFSSSTSSPNLFSCVRRRVTDEMNVSLLQPFTIAKVKALCFLWPRRKHQGPMACRRPSINTSGRCWDMTWPCLFFVVWRKKVCQRVSMILTSSFCQKKKILERVSDLLPIALCNVVYKVLGKMLTNRLKGSLELVVSPSQSAFVPERLLTDNVIVAGEIGHYLRRKTSGIVGWAALKLDMAKAYNRMECAFLEGMLRVLGFDRGWVELLMLCVTTVKYTIQVNGEGVGTICPTRGIRQGDPLSPYLFIVCAEGLSVLLQQAKARGDIHGVRVARGAPTITHLFFADDSLLFFRANQQETMKIKGCLDLYCAASGQLINFDKSNAVFSLNTTVEVKNWISECLGVNIAADLGRYLGLPSVLGKSKIATFHYIEEKVRERIGTWQNKLLSRAGQKVLKLGLAKRIGDGRDTKIWEWPWLSDAAKPELHTACIDELRFATFSDLLDESGAWDVEVIQDIFQEEDARRIIATPVNTHFKDSWRWLGDLHGLYSVKHGYRLSTTNTGPNNTVEEFQVWNKLWALPVLPKVRNLLWRCARGVLPVRENLKTKRVFIGGGCPFCGHLAETPEHLFYECCYAREV
ncbi:PREDICTED: uncharacterized protein LOC109173056 [Ipomoea nil]|uniref:uncharacterized protein LOC109173056 n=1 Tax=Ipomoea nil TaxID=35883 RepID=UPI000900D653|nr:PREDICTED: uncharacterized protein LOC109173056 [Ipomoea nil]